MIYECLFFIIIIVICTQKAQIRKSVFLIDTLPELLCIVILLLTYTEKGGTSEMYIIQLYNYQ